MQSFIRECLLKNTKFPYLTDLLDSVEVFQCNFPWIHACAFTLSYEKLIWCILENICYFALSSPWNYFLILCFDYSRNIAYKLQHMLLKCVRFKAHHSAFQELVFMKCGEILAKNNIKWWFELTFLENFAESIYVNFHGEKQRIHSEPKTMKNNSPVKWKIPLKFKM